MSESDSYGCQVGPNCADKLAFSQVNMTVDCRHRCVSGGSRLELLSHLSKLMFTMKLLFQHQM